MYLHWLSRIHLRKSRIINIVQLLVGLFFLLNTSLLTAQELRWKSYKGKPLVLEGSISLKETLQQLVQEYAESPPPLRIYDEIPENLPMAVAKLSAQNYCLNCSCGSKA